MPTQEQIDELVEQSDMSEDEVRQWLVQSSVKASDVMNRSDNEVNRAKLKSEEERVQEALDTITDEYDEADDVDNPFIYDVCDDLGIRYMTSDVAKQVKEELRNND